VSLTLFDLLALLAVGAGAWLAWSSLRARETANAAIRDACAQRGYMFLDDTVGLTSMRPIRDGDGRLTLRRRYGFAYSDTGHNRNKGTVTMIGNKVAEVVIGEPVPARDSLH
jgi:hypothetical protein